MKYLSILYIITFLCIACNNKSHLSTNSTNSSTNATNTTVDSLKDAAKNETLAGKWYLQPALPSDTASGRIPTLDFDLKAQRFSGNTGCNAISGSFESKSDAFSFSENIISTKMACLGYNENAFLENLKKTNRYQIKNGTLQLMLNTTVISNWVRKIVVPSTKQI